MTVRDLDILGVRLRLSGPGETVDPVLFAYRRFGCETAPESLTIEMTSGDSPGIRVGDRSFRLIPGLDPTLQLYQRFLSTLLDRVDSHAMLHGAVLRAPGGDGVLIAGPSGYGKTSLTLELLRRGWGFLSDDFAPLDLRRQTVAPYPRCVGIDPTSSAPIPDAFRRAAEKENAPRLFTKVLIDVGDLLGERFLVDRPVPLRHLLLLAGPGSSTGDADPVRIEVGCDAGAADRLDAAISGIHGVTILERRSRGRLREWSLRADPTAAHRELAELLEGDDVVFREKFWDDRPDFLASPSVSSLRRLEAAELLGRELLNRRRGSRFLEVHHDDMTALLLELAGALRETHCARLTPGRLGDSADLVQSWVEGT